MQSLTTNRVVSPPFSVQRYLVGLKGPGGEIDIKQFSSDLTRTDLSTLIDKLILSLNKFDYSRKELPAYSKTDCGLITAYGRGDQSKAFEPITLEKRLFSVETPIRIEIQASKKRPNAYVLVKVIAFQEIKALCKARYKGHWLEIEMDGTSLEQQDLRKGDTFEWIPNEDGVVNDQNVRSHPRREEPGERERTAQAFDDLAAMVRQSAG